MTRGWVKVVIVALLLGGTAMGIELGRLLVQWSADPGGVWCCR